MSGAKTTRRQPDDGDGAEQQPAASGKGPEEPASSPGEKSASAHPPILRRVGGWLRRAGQWLRRPAGALAVGGAVAVALLVGILLLRHSGKEAVKTPTLLTAIAKPDASPAPSPAVWTPPPGWEEVPQPACPCSRRLPRRRHRRVGHCGSPRRSSTRCPSPRPRRPPPGRRQGQGHGTRSIRLFVLRRPKRPGGRPIQSSPIRPRSSRRFLTGY